MDFVKIGEILEGKYEGEEVAIRGWVYRERKQKKNVFVLLRDDSGVIQCVISSDSPFWEEANKVTIESSVQLEGLVKKDERAPGGYEIKVSKFHIVGLAERFPITKDQSEEFLRDIRHLSIRKRYYTNIFKVRSTVFEGIHEFFKERGFYEIQSPTFTLVGAEGGSTLFEVNYFGRKVYLTQTWQLYAEAMIYSLQNIYTIAPSYRAEKSRTRRHLTEFWHHEMESAWMNHNELMKFEEDLVTYLVRYVLERRKKELLELGRDIKELEELKAPFPKITYEEAIKKLGLKWGDDLTDEQERKLVAEYGKPLFITNFPRELKAFYMRVDPDNPKTVLASDLLLPGVGETFGGSERIYDLDELMDSLKLFNLDPEEYKWYIDLRRYGTVPHSGYGMGIGRFVMWITGAKHIMDTVPFPRTINRVYP